MTRSEDCQFVPIDNQVAVNNFEVLCKIFKNEILTDLNSVMRLYSHFIHYYRNTKMYAKICISIQFAVVQGEPSSAEFQFTTESERVGLMKERYRDNKNVTWPEAAPRDPQRVGTATNRTISLRPVRVP